MRAVALLCTLALLGAALALGSGASASPHRADDDATWTPAALPNGQVGEPYSVVVKVTIPAEFQAGAQQGPPACANDGSVVREAPIYDDCSQLPPGVTLERPGGNGDSSTLQGTPTRKGMYTFRLLDTWLENGKLAYSWRPFTIVIADAPTRPPARMGRPRVSLDLSGPKVIHWGAIRAIPKGESVAIVVVSAVPGFGLGFILGLILTPEKRYWVRAPADLGYRLRVVNLGDGKASSVHATVSFWDASGAPVIVRSDGRELNRETLNKPSLGPGEAWDVKIPARLIERGDPQLEGGTIDKTQFVRLIKSGLVVKADIRIDEAGGVAKGRDEVRSAFREKK